MDTTLKDIGNIPALLANSLLSGSQMWWRPAASIAPAEFVAFIKRMEYEGFGQEARANVALALDELRRAAVRGEIAAPLTLKTSADAPNRLSAGELVTKLAVLSVVRRRALLWALEMGVEAETATLLNWTHWRQIQVEASEFAVRLVRAQPRHLFADLVFWERQEGRPMPVLNLRRDAQRAFDLDWIDLLQGYQSLIYLL